MEVDKEWAISLSCHLFLENGMNKRFSNDDNNNKSYYVFYLYSAFHDTQRNFAKLNLKSTL